MVVNFTAHTPDLSPSSKNVFEYLEKENEARLESYIESLDEGKEEEIQIDTNQFFSSELSFENEEKKETFFSSQDAIKSIDNNSSSNHKSDASNFFMINVSPSKSELDHLNKLVQIEMKTKGLDENKIEILEKTLEGKNLIFQIKNDLVHQHLREYSRDVMKEYAENFNREVFKNESKLPTKSEMAALSKEVNSQLKDLDIDRKNPEYGLKFEELRNQIGASKGFDFSTRKLNENDLTWFGKVEEKRTYKENDRWVMQNKSIRKEIEQLETLGGKKSEIDVLNISLNRDRTTGEIVRAGMQKGGDQYHIHIVVSRYSNAKSKDQKISLSPLANHKRGKVADSNKQVGFDRSQFFNRVEKAFDEKFKFQRQNTYENYNARKKQRLSNSVNGLSRNVTSSIKSQITKPIKQEIYNLSGMKEINKLNLNNSISKELGFRIPISLPKSPAEMAFKVLRQTMGKIMDTGRGY